VTPGLRARAPFVALALGTTALGLAVHWRGQWLPPAARDVAGDALWAAMIAWWIGAAAPHVAPWRRALVALVVCFAVELGQRLRTPRLDALRGAAIGHLVLGSDFDPRDLGAYTLGVLGALVLERSARRRRSALGARRPATAGTRTTADD
jgi:hypothetical protein